MDELTLKEINRLVLKGGDKWQQADFDSIFFLLGMLAGKIYKENHNDK